MAELPEELLEYLRKRLENHSFSMSHRFYPLQFSTMGHARVNRYYIEVPIPEELSKEQLEFVYAMEIHETAHVLYSSTDFRRIEKFLRKHPEIKYHGLAKSIWNHMEDYRVNTLICYSHPGSAKIMHRVHMKLCRERPRLISRPEEALLYELSHLPYNKNFDEEGEEKLQEACALVRGIVGCINMDETLDLLPKVYKIFEPPEPKDKFEENERREEDEMRERDEDKSMEEHNPDTDEEEVEQNIEEANKKKEEEHGEEDDPYERIAFSEEEEDEDDREEEDEDEDGDEVEEGEDEDEEEDSGVSIQNHETPDQDETVDTTLEQAEKMYIEILREDMQTKKELEDITDERETKEKVYHKIVQYQEQDG